VIGNGGRSPAVQYCVITLIFPDVPVGIVMVSSSALNSDQGLPFSVTDFIGAFPGARKRSFVVAEMEVGN